MATYDHSSTHSRIREQVDAWCQWISTVPPREHVRCGECEGPMVARWRHARDAIKLLCLECNLEVDIGRSPHWLAGNALLRGIEVGARVRVVAGIWVQKPTFDPIGVVVAIHRNEAYLEDGPLRPVVTVRYDEPVSGAVRQDWNPDQLELLPLR